jgi:acyl-ACP thioesterase
MTDAAATFTGTYRIRFDEAGPDGCLRTSGVLRYVQDLAAQHSEALGYDRVWYADRGLTWLVRAADITVARAMRYGSTLEGTTRVVGFRRVWSRRESTFSLPDGLAATVLVDWILVDRRGAPTRIPAEFEEVFGASPAGLALGRVELGQPPSGTTPERRLAVRRQELDPMRHVNNAVYADWLDEAVSTAGGEPDVERIPRRVRLEYAAAAAPGAELHTRCWETDGGWSFRATDGRSGTDIVRGRLEPIDAR